jgi:bacillithiol biosynthesis cysteine-adding enzyme BshC
MRDRFPLASLPIATRFTRAYIEEFPSVADWFDYNPHNEADWAARLEELDAQPWPHSAATAELVAEQQERWGADEAAIRAAHGLGQPRTYMVVTGQQPGLFGGPLYTQLKAMTAVLLVGQLAQRFPSRGFVPVFWVASADSDFDEVASTHLLNDKHEVSELRLRSPRTEHQMLTARSFSRQQWERALEEAAQAIPEGSHREETLDELRRAYLSADVEEPGSLARGFARWMAHLFRGTGLVIIEPQDLLARADVGALYSTQLRRSAEARTVLAARSSQIMERGYTPQALLLENDSQLFHVDETGNRDKLLRGAEGKFHARRSAQDWSAEELATEAETHPERFTPSALLRPVIESMLFPTAAWVGGQAELAYRAQSQALFQLHGMKHPPAFLRHHGALLPRRDWDALSAAGYGYDTVEAEPQQWAKRVAEGQLPSELHGALRAYHLAAEHADDALIAAVEKHLPQLQRSLRTMRGKLQWHLARVERKVLAASLRQQHDGARRLLEAQAALYPGSKPQERVLNALSFLPQSAFELIPRLLGEMNAPCWEFCLMMVPE